jgi:hypothetical protein
MGACWQWLIPKEQWSTMRTFFLQPTANGLKNIPNLQIWNNFDFSVGDCHYRCPCYVADFLSPLRGVLSSVVFTLRIRLFPDFLLKRRILNCRFADIVSSAYGKPIHFGESERDFFLSVFRECGISGFIQSVLQNSSEPVAISHANFFE